MVIPPSIGNPYNGYINPYYWVDDHLHLQGTNGSLDPSTYECWNNFPEPKREQNISTPPQNSFWNSLFFVPSFKGTVLICCSTKGGQTKTSDPSRPKKKLHSWFNATWAIWELRCSIIRHIHQVSTDTWVMRGKVCWNGWEWERFFGGSQASGVFLGPPMKNMIFGHGMMMYNFMFHWHR